jgi:hypothetical protein
MVLCSFLYLSRSISIHAEIINPGTERVAKCLSCSSLVLFCQLLLVPAVQVCWYDSELFHELFLVMTVIGPRVGALPNGACQRP